MQVPETITLLRLPPHASPCPASDEALLLTDGPSPGSCLASEPPAPQPQPQALPWSCSDLERVDSASLHPALLCPAGPPGALSGEWVSQEVTDLETWPVSLP